MAARLLGRYGKTGASVRPYAGPLSARRGSSWSPRGLETQSGLFGNLWNTRIVARKSQLRSPLRHGAGVALARQHHQYQVYGHPRRLEGAVSGVSEEDWLPFYSAPVGISRDHPSRTD